MPCYEFPPLGGGGSLATETPDVAMALGGVLAGVIGACLGAAIVTLLNLVLEA